MLSGPERETWKTAWQEGATPRAKVALRVRRGGPPPYRHRASPRRAGLPYRWLPVTGNELLIIPATGPCPLVLTATLPEPTGSAPAGLRRRFPPHAEGHVAKAPAVHQTLPVLYCLNAHIPRRRCPYKVGPVRM